MSPAMLRELGLICLLKDTESLAKLYFRNAIKEKSINIQISDNTLYIHSLHTSFISTCKKTPTLCSHPTRIFTNRHPLTKIHIVKHHTSVCTICGLCSLKLFTAWNTSKSPSAFTRSRILLSAMNVPVLPAPALQHKYSRIKMLNEK